MLVKGNDVIGLDVVTLDNGEKHGKVKDIVYDPEGHTVKALLIDGGGLFSGQKVILIQNIHAIGKDAVTVDSMDAISSTKDVEQSIGTASKNDHYLTKTKIVTENGTDLGQVSDILFDPQTGKVTELEVSQGLFKNAQSGMKRVKVDDITTIGKDATVVRAYTEQYIERQAQEKGIQGKINAGKQKMPDIVDRAKAKTKEGLETVKTKAREAYEDPRTQDALGNIKEKTNQVKDRVRETGKNVQQNVGQADREQLTRQAGERVGKAAGDFSKSAQEFAREVQESIAAGYQSAKGGSASSEDHTQDKNQDDSNVKEGDRTIEKKSVHTEIEEVNK